MVCQCTMHDLVSEHTFQLRRSQLLYEPWIVGKSPPVRGHGGKPRHGDQLEAQAQRSEERLIQEELSAGAGELFLNGGWTQNISHGRDIRGCQWIADNEIS